MNVAFSRQSSALSLDLESEDEYTVRSSRKRDHELHALKQKLKSAEKTINRLQQERDAALNASNATRHDRSNDMEQDYDEVGLALV